MAIGVASANGDSFIKVARIIVWFAEVKNISNAMLLTYNKKCWYTCSTSNIQNQVKEG
jgi:hypothetical protein